MELVNLLLQHVDTRNCKVDQVRRGAYLFSDVLRLLDNFHVRMLQATMA
jgi:hypothetical protein